MILVTVGTHHQGFDRLVRAMDDYAATTAERVVIQRGSTTYAPRHASSFAYTDQETMESLYREARVVVMHAAAGAILLALKLGKPMVVVPRRRDCSEHMDDHQRQLATALGSRGWARVVQNPSGTSLGAAIEVAAAAPTGRPGGSKLARVLREQLTVWDDERGARRRRGL